MGGPASLPFELHRSIIPVVRIFITYSIDRVEVRRVCFDYREACRRLVEVRRVGLDYHHACIGLVEVSSVLEDIVEDRIVCFDYR